MAFVDASSAAVAGAFSATCCYPLEVLKVKIQSSSSSSSSTTTMIKQIVESGEAFRGVHLAALCSATEKSVYFYAYGLLRRLVASKRDPPAVWLNLLIGSLSEWFHLPLTLPLEVVVTKIQTSKTKPAPSVRSVIRGILSSTDGISGFYRGIGAYLVLCLKPAIQYTVFEKLKAAWAGAGKSLSAGEAFFFGAVARAVSTIMVYPYIRAKVLTQTGGGDESNESTKPNRRPSSMLATIADVYRNAGAAGLYQGVSPELTRGVLSAALMMMAKEKIHGVIAKAVVGKTR